jgi:hypothetical protein
MSSTGKDGPHKRHYGYHRDYGVIGRDIELDKLATLVTGFAQHQESDIVLIVLPDGTASAHLVGVIETERLVRRHGDSVVGIYPQHRQVKGLREKIRQRMISEVNAHMARHDQREAA